MVHTSQSQPPIGQNLMCIVYHDVKLPVYHKRQLKLNLKQTFYYIRFFTDVGSLVDYLNHQFIVNKLFIIVNGDDAKPLCENLEHEKESLQDPLVYELQFNKPLKSELSNDRRFQYIDRLIEKIGDDVKEYITPEDPCDNATAENNELDIQDEVFPFGIHEFLGRQQSFCCLSREELKFVLFQSFIEVLLGIGIDEKDALERMWISCREDPAYQNDPTYQQKVNEFEEKYDSKNPIQSYTKSSFFFRAVNKAVRCEDIEKIFDFQPFIVHMHQQLDKLCSERRPTRHGPDNVVRRGKKLSKSVLQQLVDNEKKLISMNGFLSTTRSNNVAHIFAGTGTNRKGYESVLFEMDIDEKIDTKRPYADISEVSEIPEEEEVLFFMGFVWRIKKVDQLPDDSWKVILQLSTRMDADLTRRFKELNNKCTFFTLGKILHELGEYKNAIIFYERMLDLTSELPEKKIRADIHFHIAISAFEDGSFTQALDHLKKAERLINELLQLSDEESVAFLPVLATDVPLSLIRILMNKGLIYQKKKDYKNAEISFDEALKKHGTNNEKAWVHFHLGVLHFCQRNYEKAHNNYCQALEWAEDPLLKTEINQRLKILHQMSSTS